MKLDDLKAVPSIIHLIRKAGQTDTPPSKFFFGYCKMRNGWAWTLTATIINLAVVWAVAILAAYLFNLIGTWR